MLTPLENSERDIPLHKIRCVPCKYYGEKEQNVPAEDVVEVELREGADVEELRTAVAARLRPKTRGVWPLRQTLRASPGNVHFFHASCKEEEEKVEEMDRTISVGEPEKHHRDDVEWIPLNDGAAIWKLATKKRILSDERHSAVSAATTGPMSAGEEGELKSAASFYYAVEGAYGDDDLLACCALCACLVACLACCCAASEAGKKNNNANNNNNNYHKPPQAQQPQVNQTNQYNYYGAQPTPGYNGNSNYGYGQPQGAYNQGAYNQGAYNQGAYNQGGYNAPYANNYQQAPAGAAGYGAPPNAYQQQPQYNNNGVYYSNENPL